MKDVDRLAAEKLRDHERTSKHAARDRQRAAAEEHAALKARLESLIERALAEFPSTRREDIVPFRVRPRGIGRRVQTKASWPIGAVYRRESSRWTGGDMPIYLISNGAIAWSPSNDPRPAGDRLQDIFDDEDLARICRTLEGMLGG